MGVDETIEKVMLARLFAAIENSERIKFDQLSHIEFVIAALCEKDRAIGILFYAYFEDLSKQLLEKLFPKTVQDIFQYPEALHSGGARNKLFYGLQWLDEETFRQLELLRKIRNQFAHHVKAVGFGDSKIKGYLSSINRYEDLVMEFLKETRPDYKIKLSLRQKYCIRALHILTQGLVPFLVAPGFLELGVHPREIHKIDSSLWPRSCRGLFGSTVWLSQLIAKHETTELAAKYMEDNKGALIEVIRDLQEGLDNAPQE